jgi:hypothetical protein
MKNTILIEDLKNIEIVINTPEVQYRICNGEIKCMLLGGHVFELSLSALADINKAVDLTNF